MLIVLDKSQKIVYKSNRLITGFLRMSDKYVKLPTDPEAYERVMSLLTAMRGLQPLLEQHPIFERDTDGTHRYIGASPGALLREAINKQLAAYAFQPALQMTDVDSSTVEWLPTDTSQNKWETMSIRLICDLYNSDRFDRLKVCVCGMLFEAADNKKHCSNGCSQANWSKTDKGRAAHRKASAVHHDQHVRQPLLAEARRVLATFPANPNKRTQRSWQQWVINRARPVKSGKKLTVNFLNRAVKSKELQPPIK